MDSNETMYWRAYGWFTKVMDWAIPLAFLAMCVAVAKAYW